MPVRYTLLHSSIYKFNREVSLRAHVCGVRAETRVLALRAHRQRAISLFAGGAPPPPPPPLLLLLSVRRFSLTVNSMSIIPPKGVDSLTTPCLLPVYPL